MSPVCYPFFQPHANFSFSPVHLDLPLFISVGTDRIRVVHLYRLIENASPTGYALGIFLSVTFHREDGFRLSASHVRSKPHHTKKAQERSVRAPYFSGNKSGIKVACFCMDNWDPFKSSLPIQTPSDTFQSHIQMALCVLVSHHQDSNGRNTNLATQNQTREWNGVALICLLTYANTPR